VITEPAVAADADVVHNANVTTVVIIITAVTFIIIITTIIAVTTVVTIIITTASTTTTTTLATKTVNTTVSITDVTAHADAELVVPEPEPPEPELLSEKDDKQRRRLKAEVTKFDVFFADSEYAPFFHSKFSTPFLFFLLSGFNSLLLSLFS